jgi:hypothetical protein
VIGRISTNVADGRHLGAGQVVNITALGGTGTAVAPALRRLRPTSRRDAGRISIVHAYEGQERSDQLGCSRFGAVEDAGRDGGGTEAGAALAVGATLVPGTGAVLAPASAFQDLMLCSFVHPKVRKTVAKSGAGDRGVSQFVNSTALGGTGTAVALLQFRPTSRRAAGRISIVHAQEGQERSE